MRRWLPALLLCALAAAHAQEKNTYRWVDDKGRAHYSDVPAARAQRLDIKRNGKVAAESPDVAAAAARMRECQRRRDQLASYSAATGITETDALGNQRSYTEAEKKKLVDRAEAQVQEYCGNAPLPPS